jgi:hypothetical protein
MNFKLFKCYIYTCNSLGIIPSWSGLERFRIFYLLESENSVRHKMD